MPVTRVVQYSGGIASWGAAERVAARYGTEHLVLLFANTQIEDSDVVSSRTPGPANSACH